MRAVRLGEISRLKNPTPLCSQRLSLSLPPVLIFRRREKKQLKSAQATVCTFSVPPKRNNFLFFRFLLWPCICVFREKAASEKRSFFTPWRLSSDELKVRREGGKKSGFVFEKKRSSRRYVFFKRRFDLGIDLMDALFWPTMQFVSAKKRKGKKVSLCFDPSKWDCACLLTNSERRKDIFFEKHLATQLLHTTDVC
jgi:hypothetical protein